ncbi:MAG: hypothetical protein ABFD91_02210 [Anaerohalosphaeraceae bacterium]
MSTIYEHTQKGNPLFYWGIPVITLSAFLVAITVIMATAGSKSIWTWSSLGCLAPGFLIAMPTMIWAGLLMSRLTVSIDSELIRVRFGSGTWRKKFHLDQIQSAAAVRNDWMMGWGIHWVGSGWLYNIAGFDAVELTFKNGKKARIGTDEPEKLAAAIQNVINADEKFLTYVQ